MHYVSDALDNLANLIGMHLSIPMALQTTLIAQLIAVNEPNVYIILFETQFIEIIINHNGFFFDTKKRHKFFDTKKKAKPLYLSILHVILFQFCQIKSIHKNIVDHLSHYANLWHAVEINKKYPHFMA